MSVTDDLRLLVKYGEDVLCRTPHWGVADNDTLDAAIHEIDQLKAENEKLKKSLADANRGAERNAWINNELAKENARAMRVVDAVKEWLNLDENDLDNDEIARPVHDALVDSVRDYERGE